MSYPTLYKNSDAFEPMYAARLKEFADEGRAAKLRPSARDSRKRALLIVDAQWDFVHPTGSLSVPGAQDDVSRLAQFIYRNANDLTSIYASLDSHLPFMIFFRSWWKDLATGKQPDPFTMITLDDVNRGRWQAVIDPLWSHKHYLPQLKQNAQKDLMIWPEHTMIGTQGHNLMPVISEALAFHAAGKISQPIYRIKGIVPRVEHYGIFAPEVLDPTHPMGGVDTATLDAIAQHEVIFVAGQAKSHCVLETMKQMVKYFANQPEVIGRIYFLMDCTSSVKHPLVNFDAIANVELAKMEKLGVQLVKSTDQIS